MKLVPAFAIVTGLFAAISSGFAHQEKAGDLVIDHPWARASLGNVPNGAAYMEIENNGDEADRLVAASSENAERVELHTHVMNGDIMRMQKVDGGIVIPAGETVSFEPGGLHVMMFGLKEKLVAGEATFLTLQFEKAGDVDIMVMISKSAPQSNSEKTGPHADH